MNYYILVVFMLSLISCQNNTIHYPITYIGLDTVFHEADKKEFSWDSTLLIQTDDRHIVFKQSSPSYDLPSKSSPTTAVATLGSYFDCNGIVKKDTLGKLLIGWELDIKDYFSCQENSTSALQFLSEKEMLLDISKDTICIGDVICVKQ